MILLHGGCAPDDPVGWRVVAVFGVGLIGSSVVRHLVSEGRLLPRKLAFSWSDRVQAAEQLADIQRYILEYVGQLRENTVGDKPGAIVVLWSAGRGGFSATEMELEKEQASFESVVSFADRLFAAVPEARHGFHMLSSAGGLFEGQRLVRADTPPCPQRPYGWAKLRQERFLEQWSTPAAKAIYRPSSVYGYPDAGQRAGLIPILLASSIHRGVVRFSGAMDTLRDFVKTGDIGRFVAQQVLSAAQSSAVHTLATARPASLYQVKSLVEQVVQRRVFAIYQAELDNTGHNSFLPSALPPAWAPTDLEVGIREIYLRMLSS